MGPDPVFGKQWFKQHIWKQEKQGQSRLWLAADMATNHAGIVIGRDWEGKSLPVLLPL